LYTSTLYAHRTHTFIVYDMFAVFPDQLFVLSVLITCIISARGLLIWTTGSPK